MGDLIGNVVDSELYYFPKAEFDRVRALKAPACDVVALFADMARFNALYMIARAGSGHIGSSFSCMELVAQLLLEEMDANAGDVFFSSKGHDAPALYALMIALGRLPEESIHALRRLGGLPGHPDIGTSGIVTNTGSLGMGVSKAKGILAARRLRGERGRVFVMTGDGELQEGQIWESLISAANDRLAELTVIIDHNKFQSDYAVECTSSLGDLPAKFAAFGWHVELVDGHDVSLIEEAFGRLRAVLKRPKVVIAETIKGKGVSFMESAAIDSDVEMFRFHSGAPTAKEYLRAVEEIEGRIASRLWALGAKPISAEKVSRPVAAKPAAASVRLIPAYTEALIEAGNRHGDLVALDADLVTDMGLLPFAKNFPNRFFECGIAEQDMVGQAGGMARSGLLPVVHSFSSFLSARPNEQIFNNATEGTRIVYVGGLSGVLPAGPGHSHQSLREVSAVGGIPGLVVVEPCCPEEVGPLLDWCLEKHNGPSFLRLVSVPYPTDVRLPLDYKLEVGRGLELRVGRDATIIASGLIMVAEALAAADLLARKNRLIGVVNLPWLNRVDRNWIADVGARTDAIVTLENHFTAGGQGTMVLAELASSNARRMPRCLSIGVDAVPPSGRNEEVLAALRLDRQSIAARIETFLPA